LINEDKKHCKADTRANCCSQIAINECKMHHMFRLDTVTIGVDLGKRGKLRFLVDTGAGISIIRGAKLQPVVNFEPANGISVKGISDTLLKTEEIVLLRLFTLTHETAHLFHVIGEDFGCRYDGILGRDFWKDRGASIDFCNRVITMGEIVLQFDNKPDETIDSTRLLTLNSRTESIVRLLTKSSGFGIITKEELGPGVYLAETLTEGIDGYCVTSIVNTSEVDVTIDHPVIELKEVQIDCDDSILTFSASISNNCTRLSIT
jgi:hypothetical protein